MEILLVTGVVAAVVLVVIGAVQRKKLLVWVRSETGGFLNSVRSDEKIAKLRVEELRAKGIKLAEAIAENKASIDKTNEDLSKAVADEIDLSSQAKRAKDNGDKDKAMNLLAQRNGKQKVIQELQKCVDALALVDGKSRESFRKIKTEIAVVESRAQVIKARSSNLKALEQLKPTLSGENEISDSIGEIEKGIDFKEAKLNATIDLLGSEDNFSAEINDDYDNL